jgi:hypothetical protein
MIDNAMRGPLGKKPEPRRVRVVHTIDDESEKGLRSKDKMHQPGATPPPLMPPQLQKMMAQMQRRQPKFQQHTPVLMPVQRGGGRRGGRGRGRGRGGFHQQDDRSFRAWNRYQVPNKRKRIPSDDARDVAKLFMPSFLEDPWKGLEASAWDEEAESAAIKTQNVYMQPPIEMHPRLTQQCAVQDEPARVFFQPSFLEDPWVHLVH